MGNAAAGQRQLDVYGELFQACRRYTRGGGELDAELGRRLADIADLVCTLLARAGLRHLGGAQRTAPLHAVQDGVLDSAPDRAAQLAEEGLIPGKRARRWRLEAEAVRRFIEERCWSEEKRSYVRFAGGQELDASLLLAALMGYGDSTGGRLASTVDAVRRELGSGPLLYRYTGEDGLAGGEGFFLTCSFWLVDALARCGRVDEAAETMEELLALANDVGLYAEEVEPRTGAFLGNFPQGLVHLALVNAAVSISERRNP